MLVLVAVDLTVSSFLVVDVFFTAFESVFFVVTDFFVICFSSDDFDEVSLSLLLPSIFLLVAFF